MRLMCHTVTATTPYVPAHSDEHCAPAAHPPPPTAHCPRTFPTRTPTSSSCLPTHQIAEELLARGAPTLLATHFHQLAQLAVLYPAARLWKLQVAAGL